MIGTLVIARHQGRLALRSLPPLVMLLAVPAVLVLLFEPLYQAASTAAGDNSDGMVTLITGQLSLFLAFIVGFAGFEMMDERTGHTWPRLRVARISVVALIAGKELTLMMVVLAQFAFLLFIGWIGPGFNAGSAWWLLATIHLLLGWVLLGFGIAVGLGANSLQVLGASERVGFLILAVFSGALVPLSLQPTWVSEVAPLTPMYWSVSSMRSVVNEQAGLGDIAGALGILLGFVVLTHALIALAVVRRRRSA